MAKCSLELELERSPAVYGAGEEIRGSLRLRAFEGFECRALRVGLQWRVRPANAKDRPFEAPPQERQLLRNDSLAEGQRVFPFEFRTPNGPSSFAGELFLVEHVIVASADVPRGIDARAEAVLVVRGVPGGYDHGTSPPPVGARNPRQASPVPAALGVGLLGCIVTPALLMLLFILSTLGPYLQAGDTLTSGDVVMALLGAAIALGFFASARRMLRDWSSQGRLGPPELTVAPLEVHAGEDVKLELTLRPTQRLQLRSAVAELRRIEWHTGRRARFERSHILGQASFSLPPWLEQGSQSKLESLFTFPDTAIPSFESPVAGVRWLIRVVVAEKKRTAFARDVHLRVMPGRSA